MWQLCIFFSQFCCDASPVIWWCFIRLWCSFVTAYSEGSHTVGVLQQHLCLCVLPHDIAKTDAAKITKLDKTMFHHESSVPIYFWSKCQRSGLQVTKNIAGVRLALLWVLAFSSSPVFLFFSVVFGLLFPQIFVPHISMFCHLLISLLWCVQRIDMVPELLSSNLCSLRGGEER